MGVAILDSFRCGVTSTDPIVASDRNKNDPGIDALKEKVSGIKAGLTALEELLEAGNQSRTDLNHELPNQPSRGSPPRGGAVLAVEFFHRSPRTAPPLEDRAITIRSVGQPCAR